MKAGYVRVKGGGGGVREAERARERMKERKRKRGSDRCRMWREGRAFDKGVRMFASVVMETSYTDW